MNTLKITYQNNYATIEINQGKVNAINLELLEDLKDVFLELEQNEAIKGVLLIGKENCFSAGLDIMVLIEGGVEGGKLFWTAYHEAVRAMVMYSKPFVCGITGYAPAGATTLALCADYRVMGQGQKHVVGLHEFKMSLLIPAIMGEIYAYHLGEKAAWEAVQSARLFNSDEAVSVGLVNESVALEDVVLVAEKRLMERMQVESSVYASTKQDFRKGLLKIVKRDISERIAIIEESLKSPMTKKMATLFLEKLKKKP